MARLSQLAADPQTARRGDIYLAVATLYQSQAMRLSERERRLMREILQRLSADVEMAIRISLAERLAEDDQAPTELILLLADDRIEVARPVLLRSRILSDADLLSLLDHASEEHLVACAERPHIGERVCATLAEKHSDSVLVALVRNATAHISQQTFETLIEKSKKIAALQGPLAHRTDLPAGLALKMCEWVSDALKEHIRLSYPQISNFAEQMLEEAKQSVQSSASSANQGASKLVDKMAGAGQLKAGFLLRVLHQGQLDLFDIAFARLLGMEVDRVSQILHRSGVVPLALACRSVGIDRCVFSTVYSLSRQAIGAPTMLTVAEISQADTAFESFSKTEALGRVHALARSLSLGYPGATQEVEMAAQAC
jgi:uncharacterized protein (DUF2336 family)